MRICKTIQATIFLVKETIQTTIFLVKETINCSYWKHGCCRSEWTCPPPDVEAMDHGDIGYPISYYHVDGVFSYKSGVQYVCHVGYELAGGASNQTSTCAQDGTWTAVQNCSSRWRLLVTVLNQTSQQYFAKSLSVTMTSVCEVICMKC